MGWRVLRFFAYCRPYCWRAFLPAGALVAVHTSDAGTIVTLTDAAQLPTRVEASSSTGPFQRFDSSDTSIFDHMAQSGQGGPAGTFGSGAAQLRLEITPEKIQTNSGASASSQTQASGTYASGRSTARFSLDIVADTRTPFFFEANTWMDATIPDNYVGYRFYTPFSNELDLTVGFGYGAGVPHSGSADGMFMPGVVYRLEFAISASAASQGTVSPYGRANATATARLAIPEPTPARFIIGFIAITLALRRGPSLTRLLVAQGES